MPDDSRTTVTATICRAHSWSSGILRVVETAVSTRKVADFESMQMAICKRGFFFDLEKSGLPRQIAQFNALYETNSKEHLTVVKLMQAPSDLAVQNANEILASLKHVA